MTKMEKLLHRKQKLNQYWESIEKVSLSIDGIYSELSFDQQVVADESRKVEMEIAREKLEEYLNTDETFEKEVLGDNGNR